VQCGLLLQMVFLDFFEALLGCAEVYVTATSEQVETAEVTGDVLSPDDTQQDTMAAEVQHLSTDSAHSQPSSSQVTDSVHLLPSSSRVTDSARTLAFFYITGN